jgi:predicted TIM-barrel fold metal-dependent hydrolase
VIVDTHQHLGRSLFTGVQTTRDGLLAAMDQNGIDLAFVMPQPTREDIREYHDRIATDVHAAGGRLRGMASIDPWWSEADYFAEARRCVEELGFVALKLHPLAHNLAANHPEAEKAYGSAAELGVPLIVHTGLGTPWSLPSLCITFARKYTDLSVILAHAGWGVYSSEAFVAAEVCENIILEPSWCPAYVTQKLASTFGTERMLFGSDHLTNMPVELAKFRAVGLSDQQLTTIFETNPRRLFPLTE